VVDSNNLVKGIVTRKDFLKWKRCDF
jgi:hypothetical protein